jgi:hypothetical protein
MKACTAERPDRYCIGAYVEMAERRIRQDAGLSADIVTEINSARRFS